MAKNKKSVSKSAPSMKEADTNQGIYGLNAKKLRIKKPRTYTPGSELTGTIK